MDAAFGFCKSDPDVPISRLDYKYIEKCNDSKEIEKLLKILRSGEEGTYPDLIKFTEDRLTCINPKSKLLLKANPLKTVKDVGKDEGSSLMDDLKSWSEQIADVDKSIKEKSDVSNTDVNYPPIRTTDLKNDSEKNEVDHSKKKSSKRVVPRSYGEWEKIDVDKEVKNIDNEEKKIEKDRISKSIPKEINSHTVILEQERQNRGNLEKEKGNEAFKAGDYDEAIVYYDRSLSIDPVLTVYNNRAIAYIKLNKFEEAIRDCDTVLKKESDNIKALLRRGIAMKSLKRYEYAREDFKSVLVLAPDNKRANILLKEVTKMIGGIPSDEAEGIRDSPENHVNEQGVQNEKKQGKRMTIEEVGDSEKCDEIPRNENLLKQEVKGKGKRLNIVEVEEVENLLNMEKKDLLENSREAEPAGEGVKGPKTTRTESDISENRLQQDRNDNESSMETSKNQHKDVRNDPRCSLDKPAANSSVNDRLNAELVDTSMDSSSTIVAPPKPLPDNVISLKDNGNSFFKVGRYSEAIKCYTEAINLISDAESHAASMAVLLSNRAACKSKIGDCKGCIDDANESLKFAPTAKALLRRASAYESIEKYRNAYVDYQTALRLDGTITSAWAASTRLVQVLKDQDGRTWREKLPKAEEFAVLKNQSLPTSQSETKQNKDERGINGAQKDADSSCKSDIEKEVSESQEDKFKKTKETGNKFVQQGKYMEAADCYSSCIKLMPNEAASYTNRAMCYLKLNKPNKADADCTKALQLQPGNIKALYRRALARKTGVRYEDALKDLKNLLKLEPQNGAAKKELEIINKLWKNEMLRTQSQEIKNLADIKFPSAQKADRAHRVNIEELSSTANKAESNEKDFKDGKGIQIEEINRSELDTEQLEPGRKKKGKKLKIVEVEEYEDVYDGKDEDHNKNEQVRNGNISEKNVNLEEMTDKTDLRKNKEVLDEKSSTIETEILKSEDQRNVQEKENDDTEELVSTTLEQSKIDKTPSVTNELPEQPQNLERDIAVESTNKNVADSKNNETELENKSVVISPPIVPLSVPLPDEALQFKDAGNSLYKRGRYADAIESYTAAINVIYPDLTNHASSIAVLLSNRAACKSKIGDCKGCIDDANESLKFAPTAKALLRRASAYESIEKYRQSYVDNQSALRMDNSITSAWDASRRLAKVLKDLDGPKWRDRLPKAESFLSFTEEKENSPGTKLQKGAVNISGMNQSDSENTSNIVDTEAEIVKETEINNKSEIKEGKARLSESRDQKFKRIKESGNRFVLQEKYQDAANCYSQCIDLFPEEVVSYTNRALCYLKLNKPKKALSDCSKALLLQPNNIKAYFRRALAKKACNKYMEALQDLKSLLKLEPQNAAANKELEIIKGLWREELKNTQVKPSEKANESSSETKHKSSKYTKTDDVKNNRESLGSSPKKTSKKASKDSVQKPSKNVQMKKASGFEFLQAWNELKGRPLKDHADLLTQIEPTQLPKVISNKIDGDMIQIIVSCVQEFFFTKDKLLLGFNILRYTSKAERFNMAVMFLSTKDLSKIKKVVEELDSKLKDVSLGITPKELSDLKRAYKVAL